MGAIGSICCQRHWPSFWRVCISGYDRFRVPWPGQMHPGQLGRRGLPSWIRTRSAGSVLLSGSATVSFPAIPV